MKWVSDRVFALLDQALGNVVSNTLNKLNYKRLKMKVKKDINTFIVKEYGKEYFYNKFDAYLDDNKIIENFTENCFSTEYNSYVSSTEYSERVVSNFISENPTFIQYISSIRSCAEKLFSIIFATLNNQNSDEVRIITNHLKEYFSNLRLDIENISIQNKESKMEILKNLEWKLW